VEDRIRNCSRCFLTLSLCYRYEGEWVEDMMTGRGFMIWADGRRYDGEWLENRCNGRGVLTYKNGRRYEVI
jgi:hypothetical protein